LAVKLERILTKDQIFETYLNENPYGGNIYGVEEASKTFFGKSAKDVTIAEAAYIAAIPQAPTYYSPYGKNKDKLDQRQSMWS
jgi:membrane peptidoglycan carboxypeptidase